MLRTTELHIPVTWTLDFLLSETMRVSCHLLLFGFFADLFSAIMGFNLGPQLAREKDYDLQRPQVLVATRSYMAAAYFSFQSLA